MAQMELMDEVTDALRAALARIAKAYAASWGAGKVILGRQRIIGLSNLRASLEELVATGGNRADNGSGAAVGFASLTPGAQQLSLEPEPEPEPEATQSAMGVPQGEAAQEFTAASTPSRAMGRSGGCLRRIMEVTVATLETGESASSSEFHALVGAGDVGGLLRWLLETVLFEGVDAKAVRRVGGRQQSTAR
eukprot:COSAG05_NODE_4256_length_1595_cov_13.244982_2_plen_192_part_00